MPIAGRRQTRLRAADAPYLKVGFAAFAIGSLAMSAAAAQPVIAVSPTPASSEAREAVCGMVRPMIEDIGKISTPTGIETLETVSPGGMDQWISIRGKARGNPVLRACDGISAGPARLCVSTARRRPSRP